MYLFIIVCIYILLVYLNDTSNFQEQGVLSHTLVMKNLQVTQFVLIRVHLNFNEQETTEQFPIHYK